MTLRKSREDIINILQTGAMKDLHIHSYYSDGDMSPEGIVDKWEQDGYVAIAITDHDGIEGSIIAVNYAENKDIEVVPGIEFDSEDALGTKLHILGYGVDFESAAMKEKLGVIHGWRDERNQLMRKAIAEQGYPISDEEIMSVNGGRFVGKPTFARILVNKGIYASMDEVFNDLIQEFDDKGIVKKTLQSKDVIDTIHAGGGIAVLAHPIEQKKRGETFEKFLPRLIHILDVFVEYGIDGIECYHPSASVEQSRFLESYAVNHGLIITRGSDFHSEKNNRDYSHYHR